MKSGISRILGIALLLMTLPPLPVSTANVLQDACVVGSSSSCPAQSPQEIFNLYGTTTSGSYWLNVNGVARQTYLIMDPSYPDGGMWFLGMKGSRGSTTFNNNSSYWTNQGSTIETTSLSDDVVSDAKFHAFDYLPVIKLVAVFKDRANYNFNASGSGDLGTNSFGGHTWMETITTSTMYSRFTTSSDLVNQTGYSGRLTLTRESNSSSGKLVFPYQTGYTKYGFNNTTPYVYRWGLTFNNENADSSNDTGSGIGMADYSAAAQVSYSDLLTVGPNGSSGVTNPGTFVYPSGFQIWGKMSAPSFGSPRNLSISQVTPTSVTASWSRPSSGTPSEYVLQYKLDSQNWSAAATRRVTGPLTDSPSVTVSGLSAGTYDYRVWARATTNNESSALPVTASSIVLDTTSPTRQSASIASAGTSITLTYNESLSATTAAVGAFVVRRGVSETITVTSASASGLSVTLNLGSTVLRIGESVSVTYTDPTAGDDANAIQDLAGNDAASFTVSNLIGSAQKQSQSITFGALSPRTLGTGTVSLSATASSALSVTFTSATTNECTVSGTTVTLRLAGTCTINADQAGNDTFTAASTITRSFTISETLTITTPSSGLSGTYESSYSLTLTPSGGSGDNSFTLASGSLPAGLTLIDRGETATITGTPSASGSASIQVQVSDSNGATATTSSFTLTINKATTSLSSFSIASKTFGNAPFSLTAPTVAGSIPGTFSYTSSNTLIATISDSSVTIVKAGSVTITALFTPTDSANYETSTITATLTINKAAQASLAITSATTVAFGSTLNLTALGGSGVGSVSFAVSSGDCTISGSILTPTQVTSCSITATRESDDNYLAETSTVTTITITTGSATATLSFSSASLTFGVSNQVTVTASVAGTVRFSVNTKVIKNCKARPTTLTGPFTATCSYKPDTRRPLTITAVLTPTDTRYATRTSTSGTFLVARRAGGR